MSTISTMGTLEPEQAVDVGAQVAGIIVAFGKDKRGKDISWGSKVEPGTQIGSGILPLQTFSYLRSTAVGNSQFLSARGSSS